jgi:hypothetical protein
MVVPVVGGDVMVVFQGDVVVYLVPNFVHDDMVMISQR